MATAFIDLDALTIGDVEGQTDWTTLNDDPGFGGFIEVRDVAGSNAIVMNPEGWGDIAQVAAYTGLGAITGDCDIYVEYSVETVSGLGASAGIGAALASTADLDDLYYIRHSTATARTGAEWRDGSVWNGIGAAFTTSAHADGVLSRARINRTGTTISFKWWLASETEPASFQASGTNAVIGDVYPAFANQDASAGDITYTALGIGTDGDSAPTTGGSTPVIVTPAGDQVAISDGAATASIIASARSVELSGADRLADIDGSFLTQVGWEYEWYDKTTDTNGDPINFGTFDSSAGVATVALSNSTLADGVEGTLLVKNPSNGKIRGIYELPVTVT